MLNPFKDSGSGHPGSSIERTCVMPPAQWHSSSSIPQIVTWNGTSCSTATALSSVRLGWNIRVSHACGKSVHDPSGRSKIRHDGGQLQSSARRIASKDGEPRLAVERRLEQTMDSEGAGGVLRFETVLGCPFRSPL